MPIFSGADVNNRFYDCKHAYEVLDILIDEWCDNERDTRPSHTSKLELKNELGRAVGLGNGDDHNAPAKGIYRYCSGETALSIEKALVISRYIRNYELIQWIGYQSGMIMTPRAAIDELDSMGPEDILDQIVECLKDTTRFIETLSRSYQSKPCLELINRIEGVFLKTSLQMEKCRLMFRKLIEKMLKPGSQGEIWFGFESTTKRKTPKKGGAR